MTKAVITLHTYSKEEHNRNIDSMEFTVPMDWLEPIVKAEYEMTVRDFMDSYTWDDSEILLERAKKDNVLQE